MRKTILAILLGLCTAAWAVEYKPYVASKMTAPHSTSVTYDLPDYQFYSTSVLHSSPSYSSSRIAQQGRVRVIASNERFGLQRNSGVGAGFNILGNSREKRTKTFVPQFLLENITMRSTSTLLNHSNRQDPTLSNVQTHPITPPRRIINPDDDDDDDVENGTPVGDAMLPLLLLAIAYMAIRFGRNRRSKSLCA